MGRQYTYEEKIKAISLYKEYQHCTMVIRELGYPSRTMLYYWINEYNNFGDFDTHKSLKTKYSEEQRKAAVNNYLHNGRSVTKTVRELGYPGKTLMKNGLKKICLNCLKNGIA